MAFCFLVVSIIFLFLLSVCLFVLYMLIVFYSGEATVCLYMHKKQKDTPACYSKSLSALMDE